MPFESFECQFLTTIGISIIHPKRQKVTIWVVDGSFKVQQGNPLLLLTPMTTHSIYQHKHYHYRPKPWMRSSISYVFQEGIHLSVFLLIFLFFFQEASYICVYTVKSFIYKISHNLHYIKREEEIFSSLLAQPS